MLKFPSTCLNLICLFLWSQKKHNFCAHMAALRFVTRWPLWYQALGGVPAQLITWSYHWNLQYHWIFHICTWNKLQIKCTFELHHIRVFKWDITVLRLFFCCRDGSHREEPLIHAYPIKYVWVECQVFWTRAVRIPRWIAFTTIIYIPITYSHLYVYNITWGWGSKSKVILYLFLP